MKDRLAGLEELAAYVKEVNAAMKDRPARIKEMPALCRRIVFTEALRAALEV
jgi:hypothetical protein